MTNTMYIVQNNTYGNLNRNKILHKASVGSPVWTEVDQTHLFKYFEDITDANIHMDHVDPEGKIERKVFAVKLTY